MFFKLTLEHFSFHVAATGVVTEDRELVVDEPATAFGEDRRTPAETCPVLLAFVGGESVDKTFICQHAGVDG